ncbi:MAG: T9SS type A sorting domain-containing protein [Bacteroidia bacterium]
MRNSYLFIFFTIFIFSANPSRGGHVVGTEFSMQHIGGDTFEVRLAIYRDCNAINLPDTVPATIQGLNSNYQEVLYLSIVSNTDVTSLCPSELSRCQSSSSSFPYGVQKQIFVDTVFLGNKNSCNFRVYYDGTTRSMGLSSTSYYNELTINICQSGSNSSPILQSNALTISCTSECIDHAINAVDADGDSLVYSLTPVLRDSSNSIPYLTPYSYDKPLYFNGFPNNNLPFIRPLCRGFHIDSDSGQLRFRPMQSQVAWMAVKVEEYRHGNKIGEVTRDWQAIITSCQFTDSITISPASLSTHYRTCPGDTFEMKFDIAGFDTTDSNSITWGHGIPGANVKITGNNSSKQFHLKWAPTAADIGTSPHFFSVDIVGRRCPMQDHLVKTFRIDVDSAPAANYTATPTGCGNMTLSGIDVTLTYEWTIDGDTFQIHNKSLNFPAAGDQPYTVRAFRNQCSQTFRDTVTIPFYDNLEVTAGPDIDVCLGDSFMLTATVVSGNGSYSYTWQPGSVSDRIYRGVASTNQLFTVEVVDAQGCEDTDSVLVNSLQLPSLAMHPLPEVCEDGDTLYLSNYVSPSSGTWSGPGVVDNKLVISQANDGDYLTYTFTNSQGCTSEDSVEITVNPLPSVIAGMDSLLCIKNPSFLLRGNPSGGEWTGNGVSPQGLSYIFDPLAAGVDRHELIYSYTSADNCQSSDTVLMTVDSLTPVNAGPDKNWCINRSVQTLQGQPAGGTWKGPGVTGNTFDPASAGVGTHYLVYDYSGIQDCANSDTMKVTVLPPPAVNLPADTSFCTDRPVQIPLIGMPSGGQWSGPGVQGNVFMSDVAGNGTHHLIYSYADANNCANQDTMRIEVKPRPQVHITQAPGSAQFQVQFTLNSPDSLTWVNWDFGDGTYGNDRNPLHTYPPVTDTYTVQVLATGLNGCTNGDTVQVKIIITSIEETPWLKQVKVYPNPATTHLLVESPHDELQRLTLRDAQGREVQTASDIPVLFSFDLENISPGLYILELINADNERAQLKIVIEKK